MARTEEELTTFHTNRVEAFVLRARRVAEHSLCQDVESLAEIGNVTFKVTQTVDRATGTPIDTRLRQELPPEEQLESLAARVRPVILTDLHFHAVLKSLGFLTRHSDDPRPMTNMAAHRKRWDEHVPDGDSYVGYLVQFGTTDPAVDDEETASDSTLALAWLYGDVVHADPQRREHTQKFGVRERYRAAAPLIARIARCTIELLADIRGMSEVGILKLDPSVFADQVTVGEEPFDEEVKIWMAEVGTAPPEGVTDEFSDEWTDITDLRRSRGQDEVDPMS